MVCVPFPKGPFSPNHDALLHSPVPPYGCVWLDAEQHGLRRILLPRTPVNRSLHYYSNPLENSLKARRAFEVFSRLGPRSPHAKHRTTREPSSVSRIRSGVCGGQGFVLLEGLEEPCTCC